MAILKSIIGYAPASEPETKVVNKYASAYDVYIGRGSIWGNPFPVDKHGRDECIAMYEVYIRERLSKEPRLIQELLNLKGKTLGCFCKPKRCHGDILVQLIQEFNNQ